MIRTESSALHRNEIGRNELDNGGLNKTEPDSAENQEPRCKQTGYGQPKPTQDYTYAPRGGEFTRDWIKIGDDPMAGDLMAGDLAQLYREACLGNCPFSRCPVSRLNIGSSLSNTARPQNKLTANSLRAEVNSQSKAIATSIKGANQKRSSQLATSL